MYLIINKNTNQIVRQLPNSFNLDESVQPPPPLMQLKVLRDETKPAFDAATEKLVIEPLDDLQAFTRTYRFVKAPLTAEELAAKQKADSEEATRLQIKAVYNDLRNGVGTAGERLTRVEKAVAYLLRDSLR